MLEDNHFLDLSIVIPVFNEAGNLPPLVDSISKTCLLFNYEIIAVNDGSTDGSAQELSLLAQKNKRMKILTLKRRFGQTAALAAGIDHAKGKVIVSMDGDGQNDPSDIPALLEKIKQGYDVVSGWRQNRQDAFFTRKLPSLIANALVSLVTGLKLHDYGCTLKAYRRSLISNLHIYGEMHRFLPAWIAWQGGKIAEIPVLHHARVRGRSKYGFSRTFKVIVDLLTLKFFSGYLSKPNYVFSGFGFLLLLLSGISVAIAVIDKFGPDRFPQFRIPLLLLAVFFGIVSVFLFLMGLLAEILVRLYFHNHNHKPYHLINE